MRGHRARLRKVPETNQMREPRADPQGLRLTELVGALSLAVDLGLGQSMEHARRDGFPCDNIARSAPSSTP